MLASLPTLDTIIGFVALASAVDVSTLQAVASLFNEVTMCSGSLQLVSLDAAQQPEIFCTIFALGTIMAMTLGGCMALALRIGRAFFLLGASCTASRADILFLLRNVAISAILSFSEAWTLPT